MKKVFSALSVLAAVLAIGFCISGCKVSVEENYSIDIESQVDGAVTASAETAKAGDEITIEVSLRAGYKFDTVSVQDEDGNDIETKKFMIGNHYGFKFIMPESNVIVSAGFSVCYAVIVPDTMNGTVTIKKSTVSHGSISSVSESFEQGTRLSSVYPGETVSVNVKCNEEGYESSVISVKDADGNEVEITETAEKDEYTFTMPESDVTVSAVYYYEFDGTDTVVELPKGTDGTIGTSGTYVLFGDWPQTIKAESVTVDETRCVVMGEKTYYKGSDDAWYAKCAENACSWSTCKYSDGTAVGTYEDSSTKYFKVEPIKWRILTYDYNGSGNKLLFAENILTIYRYDDDFNDYKNSEIRTWLNGTFFHGAFTPEAQFSICNTSVDNSAESTNPDGKASLWNEGVNANACENTNDRIFLLSEKEVTSETYGFDVYTDDYDAFLDLVVANTRIRNSTDFVKARGLWYNGEDYASDWILRSPYYGNMYEVYGVGYEGSSTRYGIRSVLGVCPALTL